MRGFALPVLLLFAALLLAAPFFIRVYEGKNPVFGEEPYYHARIAKHMISGDLSAADTLVYNERPYYFGPYHVFLASLSKVVGIDSASLVLPFLLGLVSVAFFYLLLGNFGIVGSRRLFISVFLVISPSFLSAFTISNPNSLAIPLYIVGIWLLSMKGGFRSFTGILGLIVLFPTILFGFLNAMLAIVIMIGLFTVEERKRASFLVFFSVVFVSALLYYLVFFVKLLPIGLLSLVVSDLGGSGFGAFSLILLVSGVLFTWGKKASYSLPYYVLLFLLSILFFYGSFAIPYLSFVVAFFSGLGFHALVSRDWNLPLLKRLTILLVFCGLLFSTISFLSRLSSSGPDILTVNALLYLNGREDGIVLSHYSNGFWIEYFAGKPVLIDSFLAGKRYSDSNEIFYSRNLDVTRRLLDRYDVRYILIDEEMRSGKVWSREDEGLLFLFRNNETFSKIYEEGRLAIWEYDGSSMRSS
ncbi:hypothetical protein HYU11_06265 [Candidatus Woesearchaeota archaeon]|nr:hypothetical protein [Candidatus Woesearchaeota archaeon]